MKNTILIVFTLLALAVVVSLAYDVVSVPIFPDTTYPLGEK